MLLRWHMARAWMSDDARGSTGALCAALWSIDVSGGPWYVLDAIGIYSSAVLYLCPFIAFSNALKISAPQSPTPETTRGDLGVEPDDSCVSRGR